MLIISIREVISGVGTTRFFSVFSSIDCHLGLKKKILELESLDEISVPNVSSVRDTNMLILLRDFVELFTTLLEKILSSENCCVSLHSLLHGKSDLCSWLRALRVSDSVKIRD